MPTHDESPSHAADRLTAAIERIGAPVCVGIDPVADRLPASVAGNAKDTPDAFASFVQGLLDAVAPYVTCVKFQSACFEVLGAASVNLLRTLTTEAHDRGLAVILDAKRGDIGISAEQYATAAFGPPSHEPDDSHPDWITINTYLGEDGIAPFLRPQRGAFALVRTSNPGGDALQSRRLADGRTVAECVAEMVAAIGRDHVGTSGYSALGAVVGATRPDDAARLRELMPQQIFLVPGFGAQGGGVDDILPCFQAGGRGAIVTASRSVIYAFEPDAADWKQPVADAARRLADEVGRAVGRR
jgi:orotidine-5'-phosphate decarboxylase